jgi:hypothetical protein
MPPERDGQAITAREHREHREIITKISLAGFYHGDAEKTILR